MTEYTEIFELVLYYNRRAVVKPSELKFDDVQKKNPELNTDELLDIYSNLKNKYKESIIKYEKIKNDSVVSEFVRITEDETFFEKVKEVENKPYFIEWHKTSKKLIDETFVKLLK